VIDFRVDLYRLGGEVRTRICSVAARGRAPILSVAHRGAFSWRKRVSITTGDAAFDQAYVVTTGTAEDAERLHAVARELLVFTSRDGVWLHSDGRKVTMSWRGMESDPLVLDAARDAVVKVASWRDTDSPYR
jgi:hypothetical protein